MKSEDERHYEKDFRYRGYTFELAFSDSRTNKSGNSWLLLFLVMTDVGSFFPSHQISRTHTKPIPADPGSRSKEKAKDDFVLPPSKCQGGVSIFLSLQAF